MLRKCSLSVFDYKKQIGNVLMWRHKFACRYCRCMYNVLRNLEKIVTFSTLLFLGAYILPIHPRPGRPPFIWKDEKETKYISYLNRTKQDNSFRVTFDQFWKEGNR